MDLRLRIETPGHGPEDRAIEVDGRARIDDLAGALAEHLGLLPGRTPFGLYSRRQKTWLRADGRVGEVGLRWGDQIVLALPDAGPVDADGMPVLVRLFVTGGPCAGLTLALGAGEHQIGRSRECDVALDGDPTVSRVHALLTVGEKGEVMLADARSTNGIVVDGRRVTGKVVLPPDQEMALGRSLLRFVGAGVPPAPEPDVAGRIDHNRPPRTVPEAPRLEFTIPAPPDTARSAAFSITGATLPLGMGVMMYYYTRQPMMLAFGLLSPLLVVGTFLEEHVGGKRDERLARRRFGEDLERLAQDIGSSHRRALRHRRLLAPDLATLAGRAASVSSNLWERRVDQPDFLLLRVGWGKLPSGISLNVERGGAETLRKQAREVEAHYGSLSAAPIAIPLAELGSVGLAGPRPAVLGMARSLALQAALLHSPVDLMLVVASDDLAPWRWVGWLPHAHPEAPPIQGKPVVAATAARDLLDRLLGLIAARRGQERTYSNQAHLKAPAVLALLDGNAGLPRGPVDRILREGPGQGVFPVWLGSERAQLPGDVGAVIELNPSTFAPRVRTRGQQAALDGASSDLASPEVAERTALDLAPIRDMGATAGTAEIPRHVSLLELLELTEQPADHIVDRWTSDDGRLAARLGLGLARQPAEISLRYDGPHALAGGMTGSGKSELLQTLVASLAASHSPSRLTFILVDYKGGAAFKDCVDLPHTVGFVTDLDGHLVNRALTSLRAELRRREEVLAEHGYKDLVDFEDRDPDHAFPSLLIVVDEFAALANDLPRFVDGMVDVAQRGRSLGIHLVLATQRPAGVINNRIRTNTNLRISLRFSDEEDSNDVIGTADAARPGLPRGRAFVRTGPGSVIELQAAHASGRTAGEGGGGGASITIRALDASGDPVDGPEGGGEAGGDISDLQRVVLACQEVAERLATPAPLRPWLPALPQVVPLAALEEQAPDGWCDRLTLALGLVDEPASQRQRVVGYGLEDDGVLLVYGGPRSGKTTLLRTLAVAACQKLPPDRLHLYAVDFATRALRSLETLPHCGAVIMGDEPDRAVRLLTMLRGEQDRRKAAIAALGANTLAEYHALGGEPLPYTLVLIDGFGAFHGMLADRDQDELLEGLEALLGESRALGIGFVLSADRPAAAPTHIASSITRRVILSLSTENEYISLGLPRSTYEEANLPAGRGFTEQGLEIQLPVIGSDPGGLAQNEQVEQLAKRLRGIHPAPAVPQVRILPTDLPAVSLPAPARPLEAAIGLIAGDLLPAWIDLRGGNFLVAGPRRSGRSTALAAFAVSLLRADRQVPLYLMAPRRQSPLVGLEGWAEAAVGSEACEDLARRLLERTRTSTEHAEDQPSGMVVLLDDGEAVVNSGPASDLETMLIEGRDLGIRLVAAIETAVAHRTFSGWFNQVQRDRRGVLLDPDTFEDGSLFGDLRLPRLRAKLPRGRGFLITTGVPVITQLAHVG